MTDLPFTSEDEREWVADGDDVTGGGAAEVDGGTIDDTATIDARVLTEASEFDAVEQRRAVTPDDERDVVLPDDER